MNLLSKLNSSAKIKTIEPREIFMTLPSKAPGYGYPRDVQSEVWKKWFDIRNEKNVILKMNTGSGKTVVGLIMLQSCLNEDKGPAIYVVPDNYLVNHKIAPFRCKNFCGIKNHSLLQDILLLYFCYNEVF